MRNEFIESLFGNVADVQQVGDRQWIVTTERWTGMRDYNGVNVYEVVKTWVRVARSGRVSVGPVSHDLV